MFTSDASTIARIRWAGAGLEGTSSRVAPSITIDRLKAVRGMLRKIRYEYDENKTPKLMKPIPKA